MVSPSSPLQLVKQHTCHSHNVLPTGDGRKGRGGGVEPSPLIHVSACVWLHGVYGLLVDNMKSTECIDSIYSPPQSNAHPTNRSITHFV